MIPDSDSATRTSTSTSTRTPADLVDPTPESASESASAATATAPARRYPLRWPELDFWHEFQQKPEVPTSVVAHRFQIHGPLDVAAFRLAVDQALREAEVLALRFEAPPDGAQPCKWWCASGVPALRVIDLRQEPQAAALTDDLIAADLGRPLDLRSQPLCRCWLLQSGDNAFCWYLRAHHIALDAFGFAMLEARCTELYAQRRLALPPGATSQPFLPLDVLEQESAGYEVSPRCADDGLFWREQLAGQAAALPVCDEAVLGDVHHAGRWRQPIGPAGVAGLQQVAGALELAWPDVLVALSGLALGRIFRHLGLLSRRELVVWLPFMNRFGSAAARIPALVVNILPHVVAMPRDQALDAFLLASARQLRQERRHGRYRVERMARDQGVPGERRFFFSPLINVLPFESPALPGCTLSGEVLSSGSADGVNLTYRSAADGSGLQLEVEVDPSVSLQCGEPAQLARLARQLEHLPQIIACLLVSAAQAPGLSLAAIEAELMPWLVDAFAGDSAAH